MRLLFTEHGWDEYLFWQTQDKKTLLRINRLIKSVERDGALKGEGKPESLKYEKGYSRRIDDKHRLLYTLENSTMIVLSCRGHYED